MIQGVHDVHSGTHSATVSHVVRDVVQVEQPVHEVATYPQLRIRSIWVAHSCKQPRFEPVKGIPLSFAEIPSTKEPLFAFDSSLLSMPIVSKGKVTV